MSPLLLQLATIWLYSGRIPSSQLEKSYDMLSYGLRSASSVQVTKIKKSQYDHRCFFLSKCVCVCVCGEFTLNLK